jgi:mannose-6-phosphate isomerase-like protein (cupin superfamily)
MSAGGKTKGLVSRFEETVAKIGTHGPRPFGLGLAHGSMFTLLYRPPTPDDQEPHAQDELYVVMKGSGTLVVEEEQHPFGTGDMLFVPAHAVHRFEDFTEDLLLWAIFWGPVGGEPDTIRQS